MSKKKNNLEDLPHIESGEKKRIDVHATTSELNGIAGVLESLLRKFKGLAFIFAMIPIAIAYVFSFTIAIMPGYSIVTSLYNATSSSHLFVQAFVVSFGLAVSYLLYGISLILIVPAFNRFLPLKSKSWRGNWFSLNTIPWYYHNALVQLVRYTFLDFVTPTPLNILFYRLMGMKIGKNCVVNTSNISDPCLIELEDNVTIGGSATIFGHYAQGGFLVLAPVLIKRGATVGLKASIMGDVVVGERVVVKPHDILLPKTRLPDKGKQ